MESNIIRKSPDAPHRAVIWVEASVQELTPHGECSGMSVFKVSKFPVYIDGMDRNIAIRKLNEFLEKLKVEAKKC